MADCTNFNFHYGPRVSLCGVQNGLFKVSSPDEALLQIMVPFFIDSSLLQASSDNLARELSIAWASSKLLFRVSLYCVIYNSIYNIYVYYIYIHIIANKSNLLQVEN